MTPEEIAEQQVAGGVRVMAREEAKHLLKSAMAAALADPDVDGGAKSLAGYVLQWLEGQGE